MSRPGVTVAPCYGAPRSIMKPGSQKRPLSEAADVGQGNEKKAKVAAFGPQPPKNSVALLHEYSPGITFDVVALSGKQHAPMFTMRVVVDGKSYDTVGGNKKKTKNDLADKVVSAIWPQIQEYQERRNLEKIELDEAEKEYFLKLYPGRAKGDETDTTYEAFAKVEGSDVGAQEEEKKSNYIPRPKNALRVMNDLNMRPKYSDTAEVVESDGSGTTFVIQSTLCGLTFEGRGRTRVLAKAIAAEQALGSIFKIEFEHTDDGYPMYVGDGNVLKELRLNVKKMDQEKYVDSVATKTTKAPPSESVVNVLVDGKNPVMVLNELFNAMVKYESFECMSLGNHEAECGVRAIMDGLTIEGRGPNAKAAKVQACVAALAALKANGTLARMMWEKESHCAGSLRKPGSVWKGTAQGVDCFPLNVTAVPVRAAVPLPNSLAKLNNLFPGTEYTLLASSDNPDDPWFEYSITVQEKTFSGKGRGKKAGRSDVAEIALRGLGLWGPEDDMAKKQAIATHRTREASRPRPEFRNSEFSRPPRGGRGRIFGGESMGGMRFNYSNNFISANAPNSDFSGGFGQRGFGRGSEGRGISRGFRSSMGGRGGGRGSGRGMGSALGGSSSMGFGSGSSSMGFGSLQGSSGAGGGGRMISRGGNGMRGFASMGNNASRGYRGGGMAGGMSMGRGIGGFAGFGRGVPTAHSMVTTARSLLSKITNIANEAAYEYGGEGGDFGYDGTSFQDQSYAEFGDGQGSFGGYNTMQDTPMLPQQSNSFMPVANAPSGGRIQQGGSSGRSRANFARGARGSGNIRGSMTQPSGSVGHGGGMLATTQPQFQSNTATYSTDETDYSGGSTGFQSFSSGSAVAPAGVGGANWSNTGNGNGLGWSAAYQTDFTGGFAGNNSSVYSTGMMNSW